MSSRILISNALKKLWIGGSPVIQSRLFGAQATTVSLKTRKPITSHSRFLGTVKQDNPSPSSEEVEKRKPTELESPKNKIELDKLYKTIELEVLSYEPSVLDSYQWFVVTAATHLGIPVGKCWSPLKSDKYRFPLLKSAFVHKKHQVQYEVRTYHRFLTFHKLTGSTADTFLEYVERNLPEGVGLKVTKVEVQPLPDYLQNHPTQS